ncbi:hypothetical protein QFC22_003144 [Naganishia vaughanmartiniae]|uniref:Uncharacterized protein n=1 Tax=Naganishia vaughanmartiniae TaxID=1424756 RepID=A0ACC2XA08_9TREE|nr:hypothetical protein QFC22_003144 [Naganishia vaughanmartiniae]
MIVSQELAGDERAGDLPKDFTHSPHDGPTTYKTKHSTLIIHIMPASPIIQGGIFAAGLAVGVGAASLLISNKQTPRQIAPTAVAVPTPVPVSTSSTIPQSAARPFPNANQASPIMVGQSTLSVNSQAGKEVGSDVLRYGFPGEYIQRYNLETPA